MKRFCGWVLGLAALMTTLILAACYLSHWVTKPTPQLSYVSQRDNSNWDIHLMDPQRKLTVNLTRGLFRGDARSRLPAWSPDGEMLAFVSDYGGELHVYGYTPSDDALHVLTDANLQFSHLMWAADGTELVLGTVASRDSMGVRVLNMETGKIQLRTGAQVSATYPTLSPNNEHIMFVSADDMLRYTIYVMDREGGGIRPLIETSPKVSRPVWSPDSRTIAYIDVLENRNSIYLLDVETRTIQFLLANVPVDNTLTWSPNGRQIAVTFRYGDSELVLLRDVLERREDRELSEDIHYVMEGDSKRFQLFPVWSPDSRYVAFVVSDDDMPFSEIYMTDTQNNDVQRLTVNGINDWYPSWRGVR